MLSKSLFRSLVVLSFVGFTTLVLGSALTDLRSARAEEIASESQDRNVDAAALAAQDEAIRDMAELVGKFRGQPQETQILYRYADALQQAAEMRFRIAHGRAQKTGKAVDLTEYKASLKASISPLTQLIQRHSDYKDIAHVWFMRAKAQDETGNKSEATKDYLKVTKSFSQSDDVVAAYMALADIEMDKKHHEQALVYLKAVEARRHDNHYPVAMYHMAWTYFLMGKVQPAIASSEKLLAYLTANEGEQGTERAMLENLQRDVPRFYFGAFEKKLPGYSTAKALKYFQRYAKQPELGKMTVQYAYLLRTRDYEQDLMRWKDMILAAFPDASESHEVLLATYEYQLAKGDYDAVAKSAKDIAKVARKFSDTEASTKAEKLLVDTTTALQRLLVENRDSSRANELNAELAAVYEAFSRVVKDNDPRLRSFHYNLAETLFTIKDYDKAVENYRWILEHGGFSDKSGGIAGVDASLKAISSRYEQLRKDKLIPQGLTAKPMPQKDAAPNARLVEWTKWIDQHVDHAGKGAIDNFQFEANRAMYANGQIREATERLRNFALGVPKSAFAVPAATLVLDTYIASQSWDRVENIADSFLRVDAWKGTEFNKRVYKVASDSKFKHAEMMASKRDYKSAIEQAEELEKAYPQSEHLADALTLAGNAAVKMNNRDLAIHYYDKLAVRAKDPSKAAQSRLSIAQLEEERFNFVGAANAYLAYLKLPSKATKLDRGQSDEMRRRILMYGWLGGSSEQLGKLASAKSICTPAIAGECQKYQVLRHLMGGAVPVKTSQMAAKAAFRAPLRIRGIWATIALENSSKLSWADRHRMVTELAAAWDSMDPMTRFSLLPRISVSVPNSFTWDRQGIAKTSAKLKLNQASIKHRLALVADMETAATKAAKLPWIRVRALVLSEMAGAYADLTDGLRSLPMPKRLSPAEQRAYFSMVDQLVAPFEQKTLAIRSEAYRLASNSAVESDVYETVADAMFKTPGKYGKNNGVPRQRSWADLDLDLVRSVDSQGKWSSTNYDTAEPAQVLRSRWAAAIDAGNWRQVAFFVNQSQEARRKALIAPEVIAVAKAVSLAAAGARAEGNLALSDACHGSRRDNIKSACGSARASLASL